MCVDCGGVCVCMYVCARVCICTEVDKQLTLQLVDMKK